MTDQHPITPPPELVEQWRNLPEYVSQLRIMSTVTITTEKLQDIATQAAQWGADQELEACVEWLDRNSPVIGGFHLRIDRRSKPPSLKKQALMALEDGDISPGASLTPVEVCIIRRALEQLDD